MIVRVIVAFVLMVVAGNLLLVRRRQRTERFWLRADYLALGVAFLGVLPLVADVDRLEAGIEVISARADARVALSVLRLYSDPDGNCPEYQRTKDSPEDFDQLVASQAALCEWAEVAHPRIPERLPEGADEATAVSLPALPDLHGAALRERAAMIKSAEQRYRAALEGWRSTERRLGLADWEITYKVIAPFLLAFAIALEVTKVSAQLAERRIKG